MDFDTTICAPATPVGSGALAVIRISGKESLSIVDKVFDPATGGSVLEQKAGTLRFGKIYDGKELIDEVLLSVFKAPRSYTGENSAEISCHGSLYIRQRIMNLLIKHGALLASPGEFTQRAFLNGKMDLSQAEAVADLIASETAAAHKVALQQMRGGFSDELEQLRDKLLHFVSLVELELDFSEEDVEFADREALSKLILEIRERIAVLIDSFELGNAVKKGIPVAIIGEPNVGKSTLLNALLNEDKAIVSDIAGTTRDAVEDIISIKGMLFRFTDTAGIRKTGDSIEKMGIERTMDKINKAQIVLLLIDAQKDNLKEKIEEIQAHITEQKLIVVYNKSDLVKGDYVAEKKDVESIHISAKYKKNIRALNDLLIQSVNYSQERLNDTVITNTRHLEALSKAHEACERVSEGIKMQISGDLLSQDIRDILNSIGEITGRISNDEVLGNIFRNFCIGK